MVQIAHAFPDPEKVASLMRQLSGTHFLQLIPVKTNAARWFYAQHCVEARWSVRELHREIEHTGYERSEIAKSQAPQPCSDTNPSLVFKDQYFLDFLGLRQGHDEAALEAAILRQLEAFILELGRGFAFVERQKRIVIDGDDFYLDLLFFHRRLRRLVAIELELGRFKAAHKGQMELGDVNNMREDLAVEQAELSGPIRLSASSRLGRDYCRVTPRLTDRVAEA